VGLLAPFLAPVAEPRWGASVAGSVVAESPELDAVEPPVGELASSPLLSEPSTGRPLVEAFPGPLAEQEDRRASWTASRRNSGG
jgi:hypothetical protein